MKSVVLLSLTFALSISALAQEQRTVSPVLPAAPPPATQVRPGTPATPLDSPNAPQSAQMFFVPGATNTFANGTLTNQFGFTNGFFATNNLATIQLGDVSGLMLGLQASVEQGLAVLVPLLASSAAVSASTQVSGGNAVSTQSGVAIVTTPSGNPRLGRVIGPASVTTTQAAPAFTITIGENSYEVDQQTYQTLLALQNNLQQAHALLLSLNANASGGATGNNGAWAGGFTNRFSVVTNSQQRMLLPTGR